MAQTTDYEIANSSGLVFRGRVNEVLAAVQSSNSGATAPTDTTAGMLWLDTSVTPAILRRRNAADSAWINVYSTEDLASQAEAEAGTDNTKLMTPQRTKQAITANSVAPTTEQVLSAMAGASADSVGSYAFLRKLATAVAGTSYAGSLLLYGGLRINDGSTGVTYTTTTGARSGTWRCMATATTGSSADATYTLYLRIA